MTTKTVQKPTAFGEDLIIAAEAVLYLRETSPVVLEAIGGVRIEIQRIHGGILVLATKPAQSGLPNLSLTARNARGDHYFNSQYGFYQDVRAIVQAEVDRLHLSLSEGQEDSPEDDPLEESEGAGEGFSAFIPAMFARARAFISNLR